jgi:hypothetical protein
MKLLQKRFFSIYIYLIALVFVILALLFDRPILFLIPSSLLLILMFKKQLLSDLSVKNFLTNKVLGLPMYVWYIVGIALIVWGLMN